MMLYCPITYQALVSGEKEYSQQGLKRLSKSITYIEPLPFTQEKLRQEARMRADKMSIQGVQPKISARFNPAKQRFDLVDNQGTFILKPQSSDYAQLPENEDLSMRLAQAVGIHTPLHGLVYAEDRALVYFIQRFDRVKNQKIAVEDFAQLSGMSRDTKYNYSMEKLVKVLDLYATFPILEKAELFLRVMFNFIIGNEDMHLKNYSLITENNKITLAPAYDFLNSTLALGAAKEEIALFLNGKKRNLKKIDFIDYFAKEVLNLPTKIIEQQIKKILLAQPEWKILIKHSFLSADAKTQYMTIVQDRLTRLGLQTI
jgi:serine/threonine-protein kinase HipA